MHAPRPSRARIRRASLAVDEQRLIIERTDGTVEQVTGDEALQRWQRIRRCRRTDAEHQAHQDKLADSKDAG